MKAIIMCVAFLISQAPAFAETADEAAAKAITAIAGGDDSPFGAVDGGNRGLSAYRLTTRAANLTAWLVESSFPGINLGGKDYSDLGPQLILIITSDDEPAAHMYDQDRVSGALTRVADFSLTEACERLGSNASLLKRIAPGTDPDTLAWPAVLNGLLGSGNSSPVPLGEGSARPYWWNGGRQETIKDLPGKINPQGKREQLPDEL